MSPFTFRHIAASQGCEGGYAFLAARWASDVGLVPKNCSDEDPQVGDVTVNLLGQDGDRWGTQKTLENMGSRTKKTPDLSKTNRGSTCSTQKILELKQER